MQIKNGQCLNEGKRGMNLFEIVFTPKGTKAKITVQVWAENRLMAHNFMMDNHIWGRQHSIAFVRRYPVEIETRYDERRGVVVF